MKKHILLFLSLFTVVVLSIGIASCGDDDPPPTNPKLSMAVGEMTVNEDDDGTIEVEMVLDKPASVDLIIEYEIGGSADEGSTASSDYEIQGDIGEVEFQVGQTSAVIEIELKNDNVFEGDETIELTIQDANTDKVDITNDDETEITISDDDTQTIASFTLATKTINEADGIVEIEVKLDKAATEDITIEYTLSGTARDSVTAVTPNPDLPRDYAIRSSVAGGAVTPGELVIEEGSTTGIIRFLVYSDFVIEDADQNTEPYDPETIIMTLTQATGGVTISPTSKQLTISVVQQDGKVIALFWDESYTTVDMDLFLWIKNPNGQYGLIAASAFGGFDGSIPEFVIIPSTITGASFGVSYNYYEGTNEPMNFAAEFIDFVDHEFESTGREVFEASYTLANVKVWQFPANPPLIVQTFDIDEDGNYVNISDIDVPASGSRKRSTEKTDFKRGGERPILPVNLKP